VHLIHPDPPESSLVIERLHELCDRLLSTQLSTELRELNPGVSFSFSPSQEGGMNDIDRKFVRCFSTATVRRYCVGDTLSKELESMRDGFLCRNSIKYIHQPYVNCLHGALPFFPVRSLADQPCRMVGIITVAQAVDRFDAQIQLLVNHTEKINGTPINVMATTGVELFQRMMNGGSCEKEIQAAKVSVAVACGLIRAFKAWSPEIQKAVGALVVTLNSRLTWHLGRAEVTTAQRQHP
jgi:intracellular sulfur oxidation DsrE/DsrF family protein